MTDEFDPSTLNDHQKALLDRMDKEQRTAFDDLTDAEKSEVMAAHAGKGFVSRRVASDPLRLPYSRIMHEVTKEIVLATFEQRPEVPKTATAMECYDEINGRAATPDPAEVRGRIQGLLIRGFLSAFIRGPSGRVYRVSLHAFAHNSESVFEAIERGHKIKVPAMLENLIVDFDPTIGTHNLSPDGDNDNSGMVTGTVFFREDNFREACAADPVEIDYGEPTPQAAKVAPKPQTAEVAPAAASETEKEQRATASTVETAMTAEPKNLGGRPKVHAEVALIAARLIHQRNWDGKLKKHFEAAVKKDYGKEISDKTLRTDTKPIWDGFLAERKRLKQEDEQARASSPFKVVPMRP